MQRIQRRFYYSVIGFASLFVGLGACSTDGGETSNSTGTNPGSPTPECISGESRNCICNTGGLGEEKCLNGEYAPCYCLPTGCKPGAPCGEPDCHIKAGGPPTCGNGIIDGAEQCDDANCDPTDSCNDNCQWPYCGDHIVQAPEVCDGDELCPPDCGLGFPPPGCTACKGSVFVGFLPAADGAYAYEGLIGLDGIGAACEAIGGNQLCTYEQWLELETFPGPHSPDMERLVSQILPGTCVNAWMNRTDDLVNCPAGPGGRCNNWNMNQDLVDGEYVDICNNDGTIQYSYKFDCDPTFDPSNFEAHNAPGMECSASRIYACCTTNCSL